MNTINTEQDHAAAMREIDALLAQVPEPGTPAYDRLDALTTLVDEYELSHVDHRIDDAIDPVEAIKFHLDRLGKKPKDLAAIIGCPRPRAWEILNRKRALTLSQIRALAAFGIPADRLISKYDLVANRPRRVVAARRRSPHRDPVPAAG